MTGIVRPGEHADARVVLAWGGSVYDGEEVVARVAERYPRVKFLLKGTRVTGRGVPLSLSRRHFRTSTWSSQQSSTTGVPSEAGCRGKFGSVAVRH